MKRNAIMLRSEDNVATALGDLAAGSRSVVGVGEECREVLLAQDIQYGHKFAVQDIAEGEDILKYGEVIGRATQGIPSGTHAHVHNIESLRGRGDHKE